ncbi:MAG: fused MFS/spermidine synthase [Chloroflexi bacterium]|nr:fused MFS/spermidine synthase [Chloroflexota bacterium]
MAETALEAKVSSSSTNVRGILLSFFFLSGIAGLVYEVVWTRKLLLIFGSTQYSVSTILTVYMAGLALGSLWFGRLADRADRPLRYYALLELGIGAYALFTPLLFAGLDALQVNLQRLFPAEYASFSWVRFALSFVTLITPTVLMGGTLPIMARYFVASETTLGRWVSWLYFTNTFGAVFGALLAGFVLIILLGVNATIWATALLNLAIGGATLRLQRSWPTKLEEAPTPPASASLPQEREHYRALGISHEASSDEVERAYRRLARRYHPDLNLEDREAAQRYRAIRAAWEVLGDPERRRKYDSTASTGTLTLTRAMYVALIAAVTASGFSSLSLEVSWTRALVLVLGSSVYAFALMLAAFLTGIALGALVVAGVIDRARRPWAAFAALVGLVGISILLFSTLMDQLPGLFLEAYRSTRGTFWVFQPIEIGLAFLVMLVPTTLMGAALPWAMKLYTQSAAVVGRSVGQLYFANTAGALLGSLTTGFVLITAIGMQRSIELAAAIYLLASATVIFAGPGALMRWGIAAAVAALAFAGFLLPTWDRQVMNSGVLVTASQLIQGSPNADLRELLKAGRLLYYKEGLTATVAVKETAGNLSLLINNKADASTTDIDMDNQLVSGHISMLLKPDAKRVLIVGLGSGITLGAIEQYPSVEQIDVVEIEPAVVEAAGLFAQANHDSLQDPRLRVVTNDARNFFPASSKRYDVITAEPSNPWVRGVANLFTKEQFELYKSRLAEGGIVVQWVQLYSQSPNDFRMVVNTFRSVFPHTIMWSDFFGSDVLLIGSEQPIQLDYGRLLELMAQPQIKADMARTYFDDPLTLLSYFVMDEAGMERFARDAPLHTDDHPRLEFSSPHHLYEETTSANVRAFMQYQSDVIPILTDLPLDGQSEPEVRDNLRRQLQPYAESRRLGLQGEIQAWQRNLMGASDLLEESLRAQPQNRRAALFLGEVQYVLAKNYFDLGLYEMAIPRYQRAVELRPDLLAARRGLAYSNGELGQVDEAIRQLQSILADFPNDAPSWVALGAYLSQQQRWDEAETTFRKAIENRPSEYLAHNYLAGIYLQRGQVQRAALELQLSLQANPNQPEVRQQLQQLPAP